MKKYIIWISLFLIFLVVSACSNNTNENTERTEPTSGYSVEEKEDPLTEEETENWIGAGVHHKNIDSETIEIETTDNKVLYVLSESAKEDLNKIENNSEISFLYQHHTDKKHPVIQSIKDVNYDWESHHNQKHKFDEHYHNHNQEHHKENKNHHKENKKEEHYKENDGKHHHNN